MSYRIVLISTVLYGPVLHCCSTLPLAINPFAVNNNNNNNNYNNNNNTEGFLTAIQYHVTLTRNYKKYILKQPDTDELCRRCGKESETIQHTTAACEQLAPTEYVKRHDGIARIIHQKLAEAAELIEDKIYIISTHQPMYWRMKISSCTGIAPYLRTKQYLLIDLI